MAGPDARVAPDPGAARVAFDARWSAAYDEHDAVLLAFGDVLAAMPDALLHRRPAPDRWTAAELALHVRQSYDLGRVAAEGSPSMALRVPAIAAWVSRTVLLPVLLATKRFPREAPAPREVRPDAAAASLLTPLCAAAELRDAAEAAFHALWEAHREAAHRRVTHAYFGPLTMYQAVRLLSAHTRHHVGGLIARRLGVP